MRYLPHDDLPETISSNSCGVRRTMSVCAQSFPFGFVGVGTPDTFPLAAMALNCFLSGQMVAFDAVACAGGGAPSEWPRNRAIVNRHGDVSAFTATPQGGAAPALAQGLRYRHDFRSLSVCPSIRPPSSGASRPQCPRRLVHNLPCFYTSSASGEGARLVAFLKWARA
jgi:hypothetical protein